MQFFLILLSILNLIVDCVAFFTEATLLCLLLMYITIFIYYIHMFQSKISVLTNFVYLVPIFSLFYSLLYPVLFFTNHISFTLDLINVNDIRKGALYSCIFTQCYILVTLLLPKIKQDLYSSRLFSLEAHPEVVYLDIFFWFVTIYFFISGRDIIYSRIIDNTLSSRVNTLSALYEIPRYILIQYSMVSYSIFRCFFIFNRKFSLSLIFALSNIFLFWGVNLLIGNRREFMYFFFIFFIIRLSLNHGKMKPVDIIIFILFSLYLTLKGITRISSDVFDLSSDDYLIASLGEFIFPIQTLYFHIFKNDQLLYGSSYFSFIGIFISFFFPFYKYNSLAIRFKNDYITAMGYAFSPLSESFINFSYFGCLFSSIVFSFLFYFLSKQKEKYPIVYVALLSETFNFFRSESSSFIIEFAIIYTLLKFFFNFFSNFNSYFKKDFSTEVV